MGFASHRLWDSQNKVGKKSDFLFLSIIGNSIPCCWVVVIVVVVVVAIFVRISTVYFVSGFFFFSRLEWVLSIHVMRLKKNACHCLLQKATTRKYYWLLLIQHNQFSPLMFKWFGVRARSHTYKLILYNFVHSYAQIVLKCCKIQLNLFNNYTVAIVYSHPLNGLGFLSLSLSLFTIYQSKWIDIDWFLKWNGFQFILEYILQWMSFFCDGHIT